MTCPSFKAHISNATVEKHVAIPPTTDPKGEWGLNSGQIKNRCKSPARFPLSVTFLSQLSLRESVGCQKSAAYRHISASGFPDVSVRSACGPGGNPSSVEASPCPCVLSKAAALPSWYRSPRIVTPLVTRTAGAGQYRFELPLGTSGIPNERSLAIISRSRKPHHLAAEL